MTGLNGLSIIIMGRAGQRSRSVTHNLRKIVLKAAEECDRVERVKYNNYNEQGKPKYKQ